MDYNSIIKRLKSHFGVFTDTALAEKLNVSQPTIASWKNRKIPNHILMQYSTILGDLFQVNSDMVANREPKIILGAGEEKVHTENQTTKKDVDKMENFALELARDKIESQKQEIKMYKKALEEKQAESTHWEALEFDFLCNVTLFRDGLKLGRIIDSVTEIDFQAKTLGYTKNDMERFWDIGVKHTKINEHPIEEIIDEETSKNIQKQATTLPLLFDSLKSIVGDHYIPQPIIYIHKKGHKVPAMTYNKVSWRTLKVTAKVKFLEVCNH